MERKNRELAKAVSYMTAKLFLYLHLVLSASFFLGGVYPMLGISVLCALLCGYSFFLQRRNLLRASLALLLAATMIETVAGVLLIGWGARFQLAMIMLVVLVFCGEYVGRTLRTPYLPALPLAVGIALVYLFLFFTCSDRAPVFTVSEALVRWLQLLWIVAMFGFIILCLHTLVQLTTHSEKLLTDKASADKLTGLLNRAGYDRTLAEMELDSTVLLLFDADKFKAINDNYGHETGDRVLVAISRTIRQNFRSEDRVCRIGGDEFVVLMLNAEGDQRELIRRKVNRINRELAHPDDGLPIVSLSVGVAFGAQEPDAATLFSHADEALYRVKQAGGRDCAFYADPAPVREA